VENILGNKKKREELVKRIRGKAKSILHSTHIKSPTERKREGEKERERI
jgi:hypothetical protein